MLLSAPSTRLCGSWLRRRSLVVRGSRGLVPTAPVVLIDVAVCRGKFIATGVLARGIVAVDARRSGSPAAVRCFYGAGATGRGRCVLGVCGLAILVYDRGSCVSIGI